jgi:hypothetical protein
MGNAQNWNAARARRCPTCGAKPSMPCVTRWNKKEMKVHHAARYVRK